jgi:hypothetical protein
LTQISPLKWISSLRVHREYFEWAAEQLNVKNLDDWYKLSSKDITRVGGADLLRRCYDNSLAKGKEFG